jgi:hypothetical protein
MNYVRALAVVLAAAATVALVAGTGGFSAASLARPYEVPGTAADDAALLGVETTTAEDGTVLVTVTDRGALGVATVAVRTDESVHVLSPVAVATWQGTVPVACGASVPVRITAEGVDVAVVLDRTLPVVPCESAEETEATA